MFKLIEEKESGGTFDGHTLMDYLIERIADGERRWLRECISFDEEEMDEYFGDEDEWNELELAK